jgi:uncharacterized membrane protein
MGRRYRSHAVQKGGLDYLQDAALVGLGAYAARNPNSTGSSIILNVAKYTLYFFGGIFIMFFILFVLVMIFAPKGTPKSEQGATSATATS